MRRDLRGRTALPMRPLILALAAATVAAAPRTHTPCVDTVRAFVDAQNERLASRPLHTGETPPIFHLHTPRTAGRTLHGCLLTPAIDAAQRCPRAYGPGGGAAAAAVDCVLLASHDDASLLESLPRDTRVVVHVRPPLDRVLSAYEFATEGAALWVGGRVRRPADGVNKRGPTRPSGPPIPVAAVWPWSHLVTWLVGLMEERGAGVQAPITLPEFVEAPPTLDLVHNGATLQVLGATNASRAAGAARVRACVASDAEAAAVAADAAAARLRAWVSAGGHVGTADRLDASVAAAAAALGWSMDAPTATTTQRGRAASLGGAYRACEARTRERAARRRARAAELLGSAPLGAAGRAALPARVRQRILQLNAADVRLHDVAGELLDAALARREVAPLPTPSARGGAGQGGRDEL